MDTCELKNEPLGEVQNSIHQGWKSLLLFLDEFAETIIQEKRTLPYHINIIDELHINENGHSRILYKLLSYTNEFGQFVILNSLIDYMRAHTHSSEFDKIQIKKPNITQEKERIDLWIRDKDYALIFENKVYNAVDQEAQISRYIERTKAYNYNENDIFVVYLPQQSGKEPDSQSWGTYKKSFINRYIKLSFQTDILPWLEDDVLPKIMSQETFLYTAVSQYVDYLHGLFMSRTIYNQMNMKLQEILSEHYKLKECSTNQERIELLNARINDLNEIIQQIQVIKQNYRKKTFEEWNNKVKEKYELYYNKFHSLPSSNYELNYVGVALMIDNDEVEIIIGQEGNSLYCWMGKDNSSVVPRLTAKNKKLLHFLDQYNENWLGKDFSIDDLDSVFVRFQEVINLYIK